MKLKLDADRGARSRPGDRGLEVDLPARLHLPPGLQGHLARPRARDDEQRPVPPAPSQDEASRVEADLHVLPGRPLVLPVHHPHVTGIFLMFFYRPAAELGSAAAYTDMQNIRTSVFFGDLVRNMHRWGAHLMVLSVTLHGPRVLHGLVQAAAGFNWVIGVLLLFLTLGLSFTGYLLPWDQLSIWAVTVGTSLAGTRRSSRSRRTSCCSEASWSDRTRCSVGTSCTCSRCRSCW